MYVHKNISINVFFRLQDLPPTPWKSILTSWPVWALIIVEAGHDWGSFTIISDLPKYMSDVLHFSVGQVSQNLPQYRLATFLLTHSTYICLERFVVVDSIPRPVGNVYRR